MHAHKDNAAAAKAFSFVGVNVEATMRKVENLFNECAEVLEHEATVRDHALQMATRNAHLYMLEELERGKRRAHIARMRQSVFDMRLEILERPVAMNLTRCFPAEAEIADCYVQAWGITLKWLRHFKNVEPLVQRMAVRWLYRITMDLLPASHWYAYWTHESRQLRRAMSGDPANFGLRGNDPKQYRFSLGFDGHLYQVSSEPQVQFMWNMFMDAQRINAGEKK